jgi:hypothetical protein
MCATGVNKRRLLTQLVFICKGNISAQRQMEDHKSPEFPLHIKTSCVRRRLLLTPVAHIIPFQQRPNYYLAHISCNKHSRNSKRDKSQQYV